MLGRATLLAGLVVLASHPRGSGGAGSAGPAGPAAGGAAAPCADAPLSPTAKFTCMQYACLGLCDKGLKFLKTSCPATCGYCKGGAGSELAARREAPPTPRGSQGESGRAAAINGTHVRLTWEASRRADDARSCAATHGQIAILAAKAAAEAPGAAAPEVIHSPAKLDAKICGGAGGSSGSSGKPCTFSKTVRRPGSGGEAFLWKYRRKNIFGWSAWSDFVQVPALKKVSAPPPPQVASRAAAPVQPKPKRAASRSEAGGECVDAPKMSGSYTCAQYAERKLCKMSFVAKNCRASCGLCGEGSNGGSGGSERPRAAAAPRSKPRATPSKATEKGRKPSTPTKETVRAVPPKPSHPQKRRVSASPRKPSPVGARKPPPPSQPKPGANSRVVLMGDAAKSTGKKGSDAARLRLIGGAEPVHGVCLGEQCSTRDRPLIVLGSATLPKLTLLSGGDPE